MTETDMQRCSTGNITVCPANKAILDVQTLTCESELYFQKATKDRTCQRKLADTIWDAYPGRARKHVDLSFYNTKPADDQTSARQHMGIRDADTVRRKPYQNATACEITTSKLRTIPELYGATHVNVETPLVYARKDIPILNSHELPDVKITLFSGINELERIRDHLQTSQKSLDVDTSLHVKNTVQPQTTASHWPVITAAAL
jgi:hypothetical protein